MNTIARLIVYSVSLTFVVVHLYGGLVKSLYRPKAYREDFHYLFPAQRAVGVLYMLQVFELPYTLQVGDADALIYVNAFALLFFAIQMVIMCEGYFFPRVIHARREYGIFVPGIIVIFPLFLQAIRVISLPQGYRPWAFLVIGIVFIGYFWLNVKMALKIGKTLRLVNEASYADSDDFPVRFAQYIQWVPTIVLILLAVNFIADNVWVKFARDIIFIFASIWFCIFTLNPWRKAFSSREEEFIQQMGQGAIQVSRLAEDRIEELSRRLDVLLQRDRIFTEPHITIDMLMQRLGTNSKYVTDTIRALGYQSFYDMISQHRVRYAISLIHKKPEEKLANVALDCGFSSLSSMAKAFQSQGKPAPSSYKKKAPPLSPL